MNPENILDNTKFFECVRHRCKMKIEHCLFRQLYPIDRAMKEGCAGCAQGHEILIKYGKKIKVHTQKKRPFVKRPKEFLPYL
jgi:hypothetical protein